MMSAPSSAGGGNSPGIEQKLEAQLARQFAPLDRRALGMAFGVTFALVLALVTAISLFADPGHRFPLGLLSQYFLGYSVSWTGVLVGAAWSFAMGFAGGWLLAFCRNLVLALWLMKVRIRADVNSSRNFLDHI
jgi:hypothetical protein